MGDLAASDLVPGIPVVLRLGDGEVAAETDSLLHLGQICDAHDVAAERSLRRSPPSGTVSVQTSERPPNLSPVSRPIRAELGFGFS